VLDKRLGDLKKKREWLRWSEGRRQEEEERANIARKRKFGFCESLWSQGGMVNDSETRHGGTLKRRRVLRALLVIGNGADGKKARGRGGGVKKMIALREESTRKNLRPKKHREIADSIVGGPFGRGLGRGLLPGAHGWPKKSAAA